MTPLLVPLVLLALVLLMLAGVRSAPRITLSVDEAGLLVRLGPWDAFYCLCRTLRVPLAAIQGVAAAPTEQVPRTGLRLPGTGIPGVIRAGSYGRGGQRDFWDVRRGSLLLVIELRPGAAYRRLVLEVADAHAEALRLRPALGAYTGTFRG